MKISAKGFVQIRSGKNFIADIKIVSFRPICGIFCDFPLWNVYFVSRCFYCIIFGFHCTVVIAKV